MGSARPPAWRPNGSAAAHFSRPLSRVPGLAHAGGRGARSARTAAPDMRPAASPSPASDTPAAPRTQADAATAHLQVKHMRAADPARMALLPPLRQRESALPQIHGGRAVVVVEGWRDAQRVRSSVFAPVLYTGGTNVGKSVRARRLLEEVAATTSVVVLPDPDGEGGRFRSSIVVNLACPTWHAFMPVSHAVAPAATDHHVFANVGVEHATARSIFGALSRAKLFDPRQASPRTFEEEWLKQHGLVQAHDAGVGNNIAMRRQIVCNALGLASKDGRAMLKALNRRAEPRSHGCLPLVRPCCGCASRCSERAQLCAGTASRKQRCGAYLSALAAPPLVSRREFACFWAADSRPPSGRECAGRCLPAIRRRSCRCKGRSRTRTSAWGACWSFTKL